MIETSRLKHNGFYGYGLVDYKSANEKVSILCPLHGIFEQLLRKHASGQRCPKCAFKNPHNKHDLSEFITKSRLIHGDRYSYDLVKYENSNTKVDIVCSVHGVFSQEPMAHKAGSGCPKCVKTQESNKKIKFEDFLMKARNKHGNKFEYLADTYVSYYNPMTIKCPVHGIIQMTPRFHIKGTGCKHCSRNEQAGLNKRDYTLEELSLHAEYKYLRVIGKSVVFKCDKHGVIKQSVYEHLKGSKCKKCSHDRFSKDNRADIEEQQEKLVKLYNGRYQFNFENYENNGSLIDVYCEQHGHFTKDYKHLIRGHGCQKCSISNPHNLLCKELDGIATIILNDRVELKPYEIDIFIPEKRVGIEVNGLYWHSYNRTENRNEKYRHYDKADLAVNAGVRLFQFFESEIYNKIHIVKSMIKMSMGYAEVYQARKCTIDNETDLRMFFSDNHLYGHRPATINVALRHGDRIVMAINFADKANGVYEIMRSASLCDSVVIGGFNRILTWFIRHYAPKKIYSYCDRRFSTGESYIRAGFRLVKTTDPGYFYTKRGEIYSRQKFQKHKLPAILESFDEDISESQNMFNNGYRRIWDAGHFLFERVL